MELRRAQLGHKAVFRKREKVLDQPVCRALSRACLVVVTMFDVHYATVNACK